MKIIKFGGAAVTDSQSFEMLLNFINESINTNSIFVISAFNKTSSLLKDAAISALNNNLNLSMNIIDNISDFHSNLCPDKFNFIDQFSFHIKKILKGISITNELTPRILDKILAFGEDLAIESLKNSINNSKITFFDSRQIIITNDNFGKAEPINDISRTRTINTFKNFKSRIVIIQGFVASTINGDTTTMGFESSNLTATLLADFLNASELTIYTDVDGIYNIDPKIYANSELINTIDFDTAISSANYGLKLIYPQMINLAKKKRIKVYFKNAFKMQNSQFTTIYEYTKTKEYLVIFTNITIPDNFTQSILKAKEDYIQINIINYCGVFLNRVLDTIGNYNRSGLVKILIQTPEAIQLIIKKTDSDNFCNELLDKSNFK